MFPFVRTYFQTIRRDGREEPVGARALGFPSAGRRLGDLRTPMQVLDAATRQARALADKDAGL